MFKKLSVVALFSTLISLHAHSYFDPTQIRTKDMVRAKLWYQGLDSLDKAKQSQRVSSKTVFIPEEVSISLKILEKSL